MKNRHRFHAVLIVVMTLFSPLTGMAEEFVLETRMSHSAYIVSGIYIIAYIVMGLYLIHSIRKQPFSYKNAGMVGGMIYLTYVLLLVLLPLGIMHRKSDDPLFFYHLMAEFATSTRIFVIALMPVLIALFLSLGISNIALIRHEGYSIKNLVGAGLAFGMILLTFLNILGWNLFYDRRVLNLESSDFLQITGRIIPVFFSGTLCYMECVLIGMCICAFSVTRKKLTPDKDFIIILGCKIRKDGSMYPLLRGRVDCAESFAVEQERNSGKKVIFIPSGGKGRDEVTSEAEAMAGYLRQNGVPDERILPETQSLNTRENMRFSKKIIDERKPDGKVAFATTNYHIFRAGVYAADEGLRAEGIGSHTKWYFWPNAFVREFIALLENRKWTVAINLLALLAVSIGLGICDWNIH